MSQKFSDAIKWMHAELPKCPEPLMMQWIALTIIDFCQRTWIWQETLDPWNVQDGEQDYEIDDFPDNATMEALVWVKIRGNMLQPTRDFSMINRTTIHLEEEPNEDIDDGMEVRVALRPCPDATSIDSEAFDRVWTDFFMAFADGASGKLMRMVGKDWSNEARGIQKIESYENYIRRARGHVIKGDLAQMAQQKSSIPFFRTWRRRPVAGN